MRESRFYNRHIGPNKKEINKMLSILELNSIGELIDQTVPKGIRLENPLSIQEDISENDFLIARLIAAAFINCGRAPISVSIFNI